MALLSHLSGNYSTVVASYMSQDHNIHINHKLSLAHAFCNDDNYLTCSIHTETKLAKLFVTTDTSRLFTHFNCEKIKKKHIAFKTYTNLNSHVNFDRAKHWHVKSLDAFHT